MKTNKKKLANQRQIIEKKVKSWLVLRDQKAPPSGWIKAIRGALGINTRQLADHLGIDQSSVVRLEEREAKGKASLETIEKVARAMECQLVYGIVPSAPFQSLDEIIENRARALAKEMMKKVNHSMRLEEQGTEQDDLAKQVDQLAEELKTNADSRIWNKSPSKKGTK